MDDVSDRTTILQLVQEGYYTMEQADLLLNRLENGETVETEDDNDAFNGDDIEPIFVNEINDDDENESSTDTDSTYSSIGDSADIQLEAEDDSSSVMDPTEQKLTFLHDVLSSYDSKEKIKKRIKTNKAMFGNSSSVEYKDFERFMKNINDKYIILQVFLCSQCEREIRHSTAQCISCGANHRASKEERPYSIAATSIIPQVTEILSQTFHLLVEPNESLRSKLGHFPASNIHRNGDTVTLKLIFNTDGVSPKQNFRGSLWPVYIHIAQLPNHIRGKFVYNIIAGVLSASSKPCMSAWTVFINKLKADLIFLRDTGITIKKKKLNTDLILKLQYFLPLIAEGFEQHFSSEFNQLKSHIIFIHLLTELEAYGSPYDYTAAPFESNNRKIKVYFDVHDTRSLVITVLLRFIAKREIQIQIKNYLKNSCSSRFKKLFENLSTNKNRIKPGPPNSRTKSDNSIILVKKEEKLIFCRINKIQDDVYLVSKFLGNNIMVNAFDLVTSQQWQEVIRQMSELLPFGFVATKMEEGEFQILGKENLGYYSAANNPHDGNTAVPRALFSGVEDLILQGFGVPSNKTSQTTAHCRCVLDVKQIISKTNGYLFTNERRDTEVKTPKRKMPLSMKSGKKKKTGKADEETQNVLANDGNSTPKRPAKRKPKNKKAAEKSPEILIVEPQAIPSSDESSDEEQ